MAKKSLLTFLGIILAIIFVKLIDLTFWLKGRALKLQLVALAILLIIGLVVWLNAVLGKEYRALSTILFSLMGIDCMFLYVMFNNNFTYFTLPIAGVAIGLIISIFTEQKTARSEEVYELDPETPETKVLLEEYTPDKKETTKTYSPGKFVASKYGKTYHIPKCAWAKKIKKKSQVWLKDEEEAIKKGYKKHSCVKK